MLFREASKIFFLYLSKYSDFFLNFVSSFPFEASIKLTERCNSKCITCNVWKKKPKNEWSGKEIIEIFKQLREIKIKAITLTGGEPLLREDIGNLIKKAKEITGAKVYLITNGLLLKKKAKILIESGIDYISVSLDGVEEINDKIRGIPGHFKKAIEGIKFLKKLSREKPLINIGTTLLKLNLTQIPQLIKICQELKVNWSFNLLDQSLYFFQGIDFSNLTIKDKILIKKTIDYLNKVSQKNPEVFSFPPFVLEFSKNYLEGKRPYFKCSSGFLRVFITPTFDVYSGCWALSPIGNLRKEKLKDILNSKRYKKRIKKMFNLKCPYCTCGYIFSLIIENLPSFLFWLIKNKKIIKKYFQLYL